MKKAFTFLSCLLSLAGQAQTTGGFSFQYDQRPSVSINGRTLLNPWAGGLNTTQYSTARLNNDDRDDLVVFDRTTDKVSTFVAVNSPTGNGQSGVAWQYAPEYETLFPIMYNWMLLVDYDGDGRKDLFTHGTGSIRVYHNELQNGKTSFRLVVDPLLTEGFSSKLPLYVAATDMPAITDYDDDGDIDVLVFDLTGNQVAYNQNLSVERTGKPGGLDFKRMGGTCWGHFTKEFCNDFRFGLECETGSGRIDPVTPSQARGNPAGARPLHSGNTITVLDGNGDGFKDLLIGFVTCENIAQVRNSGPNTDKANYTSFDSLFPAQNPILFPAFPATFWEDVDGDGQKDLLASPNVDFNENQAFDFRASGWFYKNAGTNQKPNFQLVQKDFLQNDMLDLGESAAPALADLDADGDLDLLVGYGGLRTGSDYRAGLWQFENKGTTQNPSFSLVTTDYLGVAQTLALTNLVPSFADVDGNGSLDLVLTGTGTRVVEMRVLFNAAPRGVPVRYNLASATRWPLTDKQIAPGDLPTVVDVDRDNKPDLLIGKYTDGTIHYLRNAGTATNPTFQLQNQTFGGLIDESTLYVRARSLVVVDLNGDQKNELISANNNGQVLIYQFPDRPDQPLTLLDSLPALGLPGLALVATAADLNGDQLPDLMLGSLAGGLRYLRNTSPKNVVTGIIEEPVSPWAFPNPTNRYITVRPPHDGHVELMSLSGQALLSPQAVREKMDAVVDLGNLPDGTYLLRLSTGNRASLVQKVVVLK